MFSAYKFWDKYLAKREAKAYFYSSDFKRMLPRVQIERSRKMLTPEQLTELLDRYDALKEKAARQAVENFMIHICRK